MPYPTKMGSPNIMMGLQVTGSFNVIFGGMPAGRQADLVLPHPSGIPAPPVHPPNPIMGSCSFKVTINGRQAAYFGSLDLCIHPMIPFPGTVIVGT